MKISKVLVILTLLWSPFSYSLSGEEMVIQGRIKSLNKEDVILETDEAKVSVPRKFLIVKASVGEKVSIRLSKTDFGTLKIVPLKK